MVAIGDGGWGIGNMGEGDLEIKTFSYKINQSREYRQ